MKFIKCVYLTLILIIPYSCINVGQKEKACNSCENVDQQEKKDTCVIHEYVDLGLPSGLKWATCNVGASDSEEYGDYYAWGETEPKDVYEWSTYKYCRGREKTFTKYCTESEYGTVDNKTRLDPEDDVAHVKWGGNWRMPTEDEWLELAKECTWTLITLNGTKGYCVKNESNGNSIFLPAAGGKGENGFCYVGTGGYYLSATLNAIVYYYSNDDGSTDFDIFDGVRFMGQSVRPVCP